MNNKLYVIAHNIRSAYNVGSIFRTADGLGVSRIYLSGYTPKPFSKKDLFESPGQKMIAKTALGAEKNIPWKKVKSIGEVIGKLQKEGVSIMALEQDEKSIDYRKFKPKFPTALILGNEPKGVDKRTLKRCDAVIEIPMHGKKNSLNVSVAFAVAGYKILENIL